MMPKSTSLNKIDFSAHWLVEILGNFFDSKNLGQHLYDGLYQKRIGVYYSRIKIQRENAKNQKAEFEKVNHLI